MKTHYDNLQVSRNASDRVIRAAWKSLAQEWHPDKHPENRQEAEKNTKIINHAYEILSNPETRKQHDEWIDLQLDNNKFNRYHTAENRNDNFNADCLIENDPIFDEAVKLVIEMQNASVKIIQDYFKISHDYAARIIDELERIGIIGPAKPGGKREVCVPPAAENRCGLNINLFCPECFKGNEYFVDNNITEVNCPFCGTTFQSWFLKVRSKRSQGNRSKNSRLFILRVIDLKESEHLIEFENLDYGDFEVRAGDLISLNYLNGNLRVLQNFTIRQYIEINSLKNNNKPSVIKKTFRAIIVNLLIIILIWQIFSYTTKKNNIFNPYQPPNNSSLSSGFRENENVSVKNTMRIYAPDELNVRSGPGTMFGVVNKLHSGDIVSVDRAENGWSFIGNGWVRSKFLVKE